MKRNFQSSNIIYELGEQITATSIKEFFDFVGIACVSMICDNLDEDKVLCVKSESDCIIYLNKGKVNLYNWDFDSFEGVIANGLREILKEIYLKTTGTEVDENFLRLIDIYIENALATDLADPIQKLKIYSDYDERMRYYESRKKLWKDVIRSLEELSKDNRYIIYATLYSKIKVNEFCNLSHYVRDYATEALLKEADEAYNHDRFYQMIYLKSKIVTQDSKYKLLAIFFLEDYVTSCSKGLFRSVAHLDREQLLKDLGKNTKKEQEKAYASNPKSIKAIFKLGVASLNAGELVKAEKYFNKILDLLQVPKLDSELGAHGKVLSVVELQYVNKCCSLLAKIAYLQDYGSSYAKRMYKRAILIYDELDDNQYLRVMYRDSSLRDELKKYLRDSIRIIQQRLD